MRPYISIDVLKSHTKALLAVVNNVATSEDFKKIFSLQAFGKTSNLKVAVDSHCSGNPSLIRKIEEFANDDANYGTLIKVMLDNLHSFTEATIPTRPADFVVQEGGQQETFFWIDERVEIDYLPNNHRFAMAKLMSDQKNDSLLFNNGEDGWVEYGSKHSALSNDFSERVAAAYKSFLADQQILKD